jgi:phosphoribosylglycinamide formyltransferase-1
MQAIIDAIKAKTLDANPALVISNNSSSYALQRAEQEGIPNYHLSSKTNPDNLNDAIIEKMKTHEVNIIVLAGYMKKLDDSIIDYVSGRVLNIHPALLPKFGGQGMYGINVHKAVIAAGEKESGPTVHLVNNRYDDGRILNQRKILVLQNDTPESLAERVLIEEHIIYAETLQKIATGAIEI